MSSEISNQIGRGSERRVAVIGGGIAGLVAALRCARAGARVSVFESSSQWGGSIRTERQASFVVEHGAEGFAADSVALHELSAELGLETALIAQQVVRSYAFDGRALYALEAGEAARRLGLSGRSTTGQGVKTFALGMQQLVDRLIDELRESVELRAATPIDSVFASGRVWQLQRGASRREFDAVVIATGARVASQLLAKAFGQVARELASSQTVPSLTLSLAYARSAIAHPLDGTGFVLDSGVSLDGCVAGSFSSAKFAGRAPHDQALLRLFFRPSQADLESPSEQLRERASRIVERLFPGSGAPSQVWEARWPEGFPIVDAEQKARVARLEQALKGHAIVLAGSAFHGSGLDAAVRSANAVANQLLRSERNASCALGAALPG